MWCVTLDAELISSHYSLEAASVAVLKMDNPNRYRLSFKECRMEIPAPNLASAESKAMMRDLERLQAALAEDALCPEDF